MAAQGRRFLSVIHFLAAVARVVTWRDADADNFTAVPDLALVEVASHKAAAIAEDTSDVQQNLSLFSARRQQSTRESGRRAAQTHFAEASGRLGREVQPDDVAVEPGTLVACDQELTELSDCRDTQTCDHRLGEAICQPEKFTCICKPGYCATEVFKELPNGLSIGAKVCTPAQSIPVRTTPAGGTDLVVYADCYAYKRKSLGADDATDSNSILATIVPADQCLGELDYTDFSDTLKGGDTGDAKTAFGRQIKLPERVPRLDVTDLPNLGPDMSKPIHSGSMLLTQKLNQTRARDIRGVLLREPCEFRFRSHPQVVLLDDDLQLQQEEAKLTEKLAKAFRHAEEETLYGPLRGELTDFLQKEQGFLKKLVLVEQGVVGSAATSARNHPDVRRVQEELSKLHQDHVAERAQKRKELYESIEKAAEDDLGKPTSNVAVKDVKELVQHIEEHWDSILKLYKRRHERLLEELTTKRDLAPVAPVTSGTPAYCFGESASEPSKLKLKHIEFCMCRVPSPISTEAERWYKWVMLQAAGDYGWTSSNSLITGPHVVNAPAPLTYLSANNFAVQEHKTLSTPDQVTIALPQRDHSQACFLQAFSKTTEAFPNVFEEVWAKPSLWSVSKQVSPDREDMLQEMLLQMLQVFEPLLLSEVGKTQSMKPGHKKVDGFIAHIIGCSNFEVARAVGKTRGSQDKLACNIGQSEITDAKAAAQTQTDGALRTDDDSLDSFVERQDKLETFVCAAALTHAYYRNEGADRPKGQPSKACGKNERVDADNAWADGVARAFEAAARHLKRPESRAAFVLAALEARFMKGLQDKETAPDFEWCQLEDPCLKSLERAYFLQKAPKKDNSVLWAIDLHTSAVRTVSVVHKQKEHALALTMGSVEVLRLGLPDGDAGQVTVGVKEDGDGTQEEQAYGPDGRVLTSGVNTGQLAKLHELLTVLEERIFDCRVKRTGLFTTKQQGAAQDEKPEVRVLVVSNADMTLYPAVANERKERWDLYGEPRDAGSPKSWFATVSTGLHMYGWQVELSTQVFDKCVWCQFGDSTEDFLKDSGMCDDDSPRMSYVYKDGSGLLPIPRFLKWKAAFDETRDTQTQSPRLFTDSAGKLLQLTDPRGLYIPEEGDAQSAAENLRDFLPTWDIAGDSLKDVSDSSEKIWSVATERIRAIYPLDDSRAAQKFTEAGGVGKQFTAGQNPHLPFDYDYDLIENCFYIDSTPFHGINLRQLLCTSGRKSPNPKYHLTTRQSIIEELLFATLSGGGKFAGSANPDWIPQQESTAQQCMSISAAAHDFSKAGSPMCSRDGLHCVEVPANPCEEGSRCECFHTSRFYESQEYFDKTREWLGIANYLMAWLLAEAAQAEFWTTLALNSDSGAEQPKNHLAEFAKKPCERPGTSSDQIMHIMQTSLPMLRGWAALQNVYTVMTGSYRDVVFPMRASGQLSGIETCSCVPMPYVSVDVPANDMPSSLLASMGQELGEPEQNVRGCMYKPKLHGEATVAGTLAMANDFWFLPPPGKKLVYDNNWFGGSEIDEEYLKSLQNIYEGVSCSLMSCSDSDFDEGKVGFFIEQHPQEPKLRGAFQNCHKAAQELRSYFVRREFYLQMAQRAGWVQDMAETMTTNVNDVKGGSLSDIGTFGSVDFEGTNPSVDHEAALVANVYTSAFRLMFSPVFGYNDAPDAGERQKHLSYSYTNGFFKDTLSAALVDKPESVDVVSDLVLKIIRSALQREQREHELEQMESRVLQLVEDIRSEKLQDKPSRRMLVSGLLQHPETKAAVIKTVLTFFADRCFIVPCHTNTMTDEDLNKIVGDDWVGRCDSGTSELKPSGLLNRSSVDTLTRVSVNKAAYFFRHS